MVVFLKGLVSHIQGYKIFSLTVSLYFLAALVANFYLNIDITGYLAFSLLVSSMLSFGLYLSTVGIDLNVLRSDLTKIILAAVVCVLLKTLVIYFVAQTFMTHTAALAVGLIFSQVDPLATSAGSSESNLTIRGKTFLQALASFDDPLTTILAVVLLTANSISDTDSVSSYLVTLTIYPVVIFMIYAVSRFSKKFQAVTTVAVLCLSSAFSAYVLSALAGLRLRSDFFVQNSEKIVTYLSLFAFMLTGLAAGGGQNWLLGILIGITAVLAHAIFTWFLTFGYDKSDKLEIAAGHQSGLTALVLTLAFSTAGIDVIKIAGPGIITTVIAHTVLKKGLLRYLYR